MIIGFTCGTFDLCHTGHMLMFKECKEHCDYLIVGLQEDPSIDRPDKNSPVMSLEERLIILEGVKYISNIMTYKTEADLYDNILTNLDIGIDVRFIGQDWEGKDYTGHELDIPVIFNSRNHNYSSSNLRYEIYRQETDKIESILNNYQSPSKM